MGFYIPAILLLLWGIVTKIRLPHWHDARYVRHPERKGWGFWHFLNSAEWTGEGLRLRARYFRYFGVAVVLVLVGIYIGKLVEA